MAKSVLDIVIRTIKEGTGDKELVRGLTDIKGAVTTAAGVAGALAGAYYAVDKALDATLGVTVAYAKEVRGLSEVSGATAEETSRLIQVAGDFFITSEQLKTATKALTKEGLSPTLETMAKLADQYVAIQDPTQRAEFLMKNFGKAGLDMADMMAQGGEALVKMGEGIENNLVLTQQTIDQAREYELALEALKGAKEDYAVAIGTEFLPVATDLLTVETETIRLMEAGLNPYEARRQAAQALTDQRRLESMAVGRLKDDLYLEVAAQMAAGDAARNATSDYAGLLGMMQQLNNATAQEIKNVAYKELQGDLMKSGDELTEEEADLLREAGIQMGIFSEESAQTAEQIETLNRRLQEGTISLGLYIAQLNSLPTSINLNVNTNYTTSRTSSSVPTPQAIGGQQTAGEPYFVHQDEVIVPAQNGYTLTRADAQSILRESLNGNSDERHVNVAFYGPVQVTANNIGDFIESIGI